MTRGVAGTSALLFSVLVAWLIWIENAQDGSVWFWTCGVLTIVGAGGGLVVGHLRNARPTGVAVAVGFVVAGFFELSLGLLVSLVPGS